MRGKKRGKTMEELTEQQKITQAVAGEDEKLFVSAISYLNKYRRPNVTAEQTIAILSHT